MTWRHGLRGAAHVWVAVILAWLAIVWQNRADALIARSQAHYDRAEDLLDWLGEDGFPYDG